MFANEDWTEFLLEQVEEILQIKVILAISVAKINDITGHNEDYNNKQVMHRNMKKKVEYWGIHIETTKEDQVPVKRGIYGILANKVLS